MRIKRRWRKSGKYFALVLLISLLITSVLGTPVLAGGYTYSTQNDNDNNCYTGSSDGDMDVTMSNSKDNYPIEFNLDAEQLPSDSALLAIYAYDVDEESGEIDKVYLNGTYIGNLSGNNGIWNTTMLNIPLHLIKKGQNTIKITIPDGWVVKIDWAQLLIDGGAADKICSRSIQISDFELSADKIRVYVDIDLEALKAGSYRIETNLLTPGGENEDTVFEDVSLNAGESKTISRSLQMDIGNATGTYSVNAFLFDSNGIMQSVDSISFGHIKDIGPGARVHQSLEPADLTRGNVNIDFRAESLIRGVEIAGIYTPDGVLHSGDQVGYTAGDNGQYSFKIRMSNGAEMGKLVRVSNIDREKPQIIISGESELDILEDSPYIDEGADAVDNMDNTVVERVQSSGTADTAVPGDYSISYSVSDTAGNVADPVSRVVHVLNRPLAMQTDSPAKSEGAVELKGHVKYLGNTVISEHGFVWGELPYPSLEYNTGQQNLGSIDNKEQFTHTLTGLEENGRYYVRTYAVNDLGTVYGNEIEFINNGKNYGVLQFEQESYDVAENAGTVTVNVIRTDGSEGDIAVDYRILDGSGAPAVYTVSFAEGIGSQEISLDIADNGVYDGGGKIYLELCDPVNAALGDRTIITINIVDDESPISFISDNLIKNGDASNGTTYWRSFSWPQLYSDGNQFYRNDKDEGGLEQEIDLSAFAEQIDANQMYWGARARYHTQDGEDARIIVYLYYDNAWHEKKRTEGYATSWSTLSINANSDGNVIAAQSECKIPPGVRKALLKIEGQNHKAFQNLDVYFDNVSLKIADKESPVIERVYSDSGLYATGDTIYIRVKFNEPVRVTGGQPQFRLDLDGERYAVYKEGSGSDELIFAYEVQQGDSTADLNYVSGAISGGTINDLYDNTAAGDLPSAAGADALAGQSDIEIDGIPAAVAFNPDGSGGSYARSHAAVVSVTDNDGVPPRYVWSSDSEALPVSGWKEFNSGDEISIQGTDGDWYLHIYAADQNGNINHAVSEAFKLDNLPPELDLSLADENWHNSSSGVDIIATAANNVDAIMIPDGNWVPGASTSYPANANGEYSFEVRDTLGMSGTASISVDKIEDIPPAIAISPDGSNDWQSTAQAVIMAGDDESGLDQVYYQWKEDTVVPGSGWIACQDGAIVEKNTNGEWFLHVKAVDAAGNESFKCSNVFQVDNTVPVLSLSASAGSEWTAGDVEINAVAEKNTGTALDYLKLPDENDTKVFAGGQHSISSTFTAAKNGTYIFDAVDKALNITSESLTINKIDKEAPEINLIPDNSDWTFNDVVVTVVTDDQQSILADAQGNVTGYTGSGVEVIKYPGTVDWAAEVGGSFTVTGNNTYQVMARDQVGNTGTRTITISNIDKIDPRVIADTEQSDWTNEIITVDFEYLDDESGVKDKNYKLTYNNSSTPPSWDDYSGPVTLAADGEHYLYYRITDQAANEVIGSYGPYRIDRTGPTQPDLVLTTGEADPYTPETWTRENVDFTLSGSTDALDNGVIYQYSLDGGSNWISAAGGTITGKVDFAYRAVDNLGNPSEAGTAQIWIDNTAPQVTAANTDYTWKNGDITAELQYTDSPSGINTREYKLDQETGTPAAWDVYGGVITIAENGEHYLHYRAEDVAGNMVEGSFGPYRVDKEAPSKPGISLNKADGSDYTAGEWSDQEVQFELSGSQDLVSGGLDYEYSLDGENTWVTAASGTVSEEGLVSLSGRAVDLAGNLSDIETVAIKSDWHPPLITLNPPAELSLEVFDEYSDAGASASDNCNGDISADIVTVNNVNTGIVGDYTVSYNVQDLAGNPAEEAVRTVHVQDTTPPVITLLGEAEVSVERLDDYIDAGVTAADNYDGNLTGNIVTVNPVDTSLEGNYTISYNVADAAGNPAEEVLRTVTVLDTTRAELVDAAPADGSIGVNRDTSVILSFSELMQAGTSFNGIKLLYGDGLTVDCIYNIEDNRLLINPVEDLSYGTDYTVKIPAAALEDLAGNTLSQDISFGFTSRRKPKPLDDTSEHYFDSEYIHTDGDTALDNAMLENEEARVSLVSDADSSINISTEIMQNLAAAEKTLIIENDGVSLEFDSGSLLPDAGDRVELGAVLLNPAERVRLLREADEGNNGLAATGSKLVDVSTHTIARDDYEHGVLKQIEDFAEPTRITIDLIGVPLDEEKIAGLTGVRYDVNEQGKVIPVKLGGTYDAENRTFSFLTDKPGVCGVSLADQLLKIELTIDEKPALVNDVTVINDVEPLIMQQRTMVPIRFVAENLGAQVEWRAEIQTVVIELEGKTLEMVIDQPLAGSDMKPVIRNDRTLVPIRYVSEELGAYVMWSPSRRDVYITR